MVAGALAELGTVDVCVLDRWRSPELEEQWPEWVGDAEWCRVEGTLDCGPAATLFSAAPVAERIAPDAVAAVRARFFSRCYDVTWCAEPRGYAPVASFVSGPVVLDLHNVLSASVASKRRLLLRRPWLGASWREAIDDPVYRPGVERRWRTWEARARGAVDRIVVCSDLDRQRVGGYATVIPNCYRRPSRPAGVAATRAGPLRIGFVGFLDYQPNFDAVRWFAERVLPRIRRAERDAEFWVIGSGGAGLKDLGRRAGVRFLGFVEDLESTLADLSVLVAPIRFGGGTRFKALEAFAHRIPMVATSIATEGLDVADGEHVLIRDDPVAFARAVLTLHRDRALRESVTAAAATLYDRRYAWERGVAAVHQLVDELAPRRGPARVSEMALESR
jgi:glycosyltransferase involved in cell wall biosynthesis